MARARAAADRRLPLAARAMWEIFPFEVEGLRIVPLQDPVVPEPPRSGEGDRSCGRCADVEPGAVWSDDRWVLTGAGPLGLPFGALLMPQAHLDVGDLDDQGAADLGRLTVCIDRAVRSLGGIGRVHVNTWGDGGAHLHMFFLARPEGFVAVARLSPGAAGRPACAGPAGSAGRGPAHRCRPAGRAQGRAHVSAETSEA